MGWTAALGHLWREHRGLVLATGLAIALTLFFAGRFAIRTVYWSQHQDVALAEWMTIGFVAQSYRVDRTDLLEALDIAAPEQRPRLTIAEIATLTGRPVEAVEVAILDAIAAVRGADPASRP